jgi:hypothetical protein
MLAITANLLSSCKTVSLPTASEAGVSFQTRAIELPELVWSKRSAAHELINVKDLTVVLSGGGNPMPDIEWLKYKPPLPWIKNIERRLLFDGSYFIRSPQAPEGATGSGRYTVREISGHTWVELAQPVAVDFIPAGRKTDIMKPAPGHLVIKTIMKPQVLRWSGTIYQLADNEGNAFVMHAYEDPAGPTTDVVLPAGWTIRRVELREPLVITPSQGGYYNIVGDCLGQGYHQYAFAGTEYPAH